MPMNPSAILLLGLCLAASAFAAPSNPGPIGVASPTTLDQKRIHSEYNEGNFEKVTADLEGFMARNKSYSQADSVFIAKHLAVVYSANPRTREKGKYFMFRLLEMLPSAKLIDMYVSDEIDRIFDKVREEFVARQNSFGVDSAEISTPRKSPATTVAANSEPLAVKPATNSPSNGRKSSKTAYFVAGGAAIMATAGVVSYLMLSDTPEKEEKIYEIP